MFVSNSVDMMKNLLQYTIHTYIIVNLEYSDVLKKLKLTFHSLFRNGLQPNCSHLIRRLKKLKQ